MTGPVNVLLVDDTVESLNALAAMLESTGLNLVRAQSAEEALLALVQQEFAAIVLDIQMPGMDGIELARLVKQRKRTRHTPILLLTAHFFEEQDALRGYDAGAVDYLSKPVKPEILRSKVGVFVELFTKSRDLAAANEALRLESLERERVAAELRASNAALETRVEIRTAEAIAASQAARHSEDRLRRTLAGVRAGVWDYDLIRNVRHWSPEMFELIGLEPRETRGLALEEFASLFHPEDLERTQRAIRDAMERGGTFEIEFRIFRPDGRIAWINSAGVVEHVEGRPVATRGLNQDVTARKSIEQALRDSERRIRVANEAAGLGTYVADIQADRIRYGPYLCQVLGLPIGTETRLRDAFRFVHPDDCELLRDAMRASLSPESDGRAGLELRVMRPGGEVRWYSFSAQLEFRDTPQGRIPVTQVGAIFDITERKQAETALREADRRKDEFLATLAHELRNPLAPLRNGLQILEVSGEDPEIATKVRAMMERQVNHMVRLVDDLLEVSRITRGKILLRKETSDLVSLVNAAIDTARPLIESRRQHLELHLPADSISVEADPVRIVQVLSNLLNNACKFTGPGGKITLAAAREEEFAVVRVRDTGVGISPALLPRIFDVFVQAEDGAARSHDGLGIGLWLSRRLVEMHGGSIQVRSEGRGAGSEFSVYLPLTSRPA